MLAAIPLLTSDMAESVSDRLMELSRKGVKIMMMSTKAADKRALEKLGFAEIRVRDQMFAGGIISDGR